MKTFILIAGVIFFIGSFFLLPHAYETLKVGQSGDVVKMKLVKMPSKCIGTVPYFITLNYNGVLYDRKTRGNFCEVHKIGDKIEVRTLPGSSIVLWPDDNGVVNFACIIGLGLFGLGIAIAVVVEKRRFDRRFKVR